MQMSWEFSLATIILGRTRYREDLPATWGDTLDNSPPALVLFRHYLGGSPHESRCSCSATDIIGNKITS